jgi:hypothetical protein
MSQSLANDLAQAGLLEGAFTVDEFCRAFRISRSQFYKLRRLGQAPALMDAGKPLISYAAAAAWRRACEEKAAGASQAD